VSPRRFSATIASLILATIAVLALGLGAGWSRLEMP